jgi:adenylate cyclase
MIPVPWQKLTLALAVGLVGAIVSIRASQAVEEYAGLHWLFYQRGPLPPAEEVVVISIDEAAARVLGLDPNPAEWPRSQHTTLVRNLAAAGVRVIVFDIHFEDPRDPVDDRDFAAAVAEAGNVILLEWLNADSTSVSGSIGVISRDARVRPIPELARAALTTAPFILPRDRPKFSQFWAFGRGHEHLPTLASVALHAYALPVHDEFVTLIDSSAAPRQAPAMSSPRTTATASVCMTQPTRQFKATSSART